MNSFTARMASARLTRLCFALAILLGAAARVRGDAITYSTTGQFDLSSGNVDLDGVKGASVTDFLSLGSLPPDGVASPWGRATFQLQFQFSGGLPAIDISGTIADIGYNFDEPVINAAVSTSATASQIASFPQIFQDLIAHPDWLHTSSFDPTLDPTSPLSISATVHVENPNEIRPIPEPTSIALFAMIAAGLGWKRASARLKSSRAC